jgi:hypothetical protein
MKAWVRLAEERAESLYDPERTANCFYEMYYFVGS